MDTKTAGSAMEWWVNGEGDIRQTAEDLYRDGYAPVGDPKYVLEQVGDRVLYRAVPDPEGAGLVMVGVRARRRPGTLIWEWVKVDEPIEDYDDFIARIYGREGYVY